MNSLDAPIPQLLSQLAIPVDIGEALGAAVGLCNGLNFDAEIVMPDHGWL